MGRESGSSASQQDRARGRAMSTGLEQALCARPLLAWVGIDLRSQSSPPIGVCTKHVRSPREFGMHTRSARDPVRFKLSQTKQVLLWRNANFAVTSCQRVSNLKTAVYAQHPRIRQVFPPQALRKACNNQLLHRPPHVGAPSQSLRILRSYRTFHRPIRLFHPPQPYVSTTCLLIY